jgi:phospholipid/cholesterol/gamma-HCH transport system ATP-binding protein
MTDDTRDDPTPPGGGDASKGPLRGDERFRRREDQQRKSKSAGVRKAIQKELESDASDDAEERDRALESGEISEVIELRNVYLAFDEPILEDVSFIAHTGETVVVVGESGTGKSTILKLILRLLVPDKGDVLIDNQGITDLDFDDALQVRQKLGMVFQGAALFDSMTVYENVAYPLREHTDLNEDEIMARVREKLEFVDLDPDKVLDQLPSELSGGMKKRVGIARGMANNPEIMLYDEPTSGLDPLTTGTITRLIMKLQRELDVTSIVVSHDIRSAFRMATKVALLAEKKIKFFGTPEEMAASDDPYIQDFLGGL